MSTDLERCAQAPRRVQAGRYRLEFESRLRFGLCDTHAGRGVSFYRTPWGAWFALRRWKRQPARPA